ncbi:MAG: hypothetical protein FWG92_06745 [Leptospirales bacterium]|nr:hypothetical protein [Leptospirales bacterium]
MLAIIHVRLLVSNYYDLSINQTVASLCPLVLPVSIDTNADFYRQKYEQTTQQGIFPQGVFPKSTRAFL